VVPWEPVPYNPGPVVHPKVRRSVAPAVAPRHRGHSLAPEHLGDRGAAATLVLAIGGMAIFIAAVAMTVGGLTLANGYAGSTPPPNVSALGMSQVFAGIALLVLGLVMVATSAALLADLPGSRPLAAGSSVIAALLAGAGVVLLLSATRRDWTLVVALGVAFLAFGSAAGILARQRR
jgi:hypothetical protein